MKKTVKLKLKKNIDSSYEIIISDNIDIGKEIKKTGLNNNFCVLIDSNVYKIYKNKVKDSFDNQKLNYQFIVIKSGEKSKRLKVLENVSGKMIKLGFNRKSTIVALGGGVTGDLAGFVAGTFMRGIPFIQVPTTLLSQVDSSVGGKVAVDLKNGKNSSGLFYQPVKVFIDVNFLKTLPDIEFNSGMMEIVKHGIIKSSKYFDFIEKNLIKIKKKDKDVLIKLICESCLIKTRVVQKDEKENNIRMILNFGHTIGHAIEIISNYKIKHGFAVGAGMIKESGISNELGLINEKDYSRIIKLINFFGVKEITFNRSKILNSIKCDKKNIKNKMLDLTIPMVLPRKIGKVEIRNFSLKEIEKFL